MEFLNTDLLDQLKYNTRRLEQLDERHYTLSMSNYYMMFDKQHERQSDLDWVIQIKKRVLKLRFKLLEKISKNAQELMFETMNENTLLTKELKAV